MGNIGYFFQIAGLFAGFIAILFYFLAIYKDDEQNNKIGNILFIIQTVLATVASFVLVYALATSYFKMEYVAQYTDRALPFIYKISAFWAGQAGSLLFWGWLITLAGIIEIMRHRKLDNKYRSSIMLIVAITSTFFLLITSTVSNPFKELDFFPADGLGMNPLLQNPGMLYHPPTLYIGYVLYTLPFAYAIASLITKDYSAKWLKLSRSWNLLAWIFLTIGIVLGAQWAYVELGWGGYWAWDPVENASLLPWLTGTAMLHSAIMYERIRRLKIWTYSLAFITFELCIFSTFLTRSGVIDSVHSFGKSALGGFFLWFMILVAVGFVILLLKGINELKEKGDFYLLSKEGMFFITNWVFVGLMLVVLFGTTLPIFSEIFSNNKSSVSISYYNKVSIPFFIALLFLAGVCPLLPYKKASLSEIFKKLWLSIVLTLVAGVIIYFNGYTKIIPLVLFMVTFFAFFAIIIQIVNNLKNAGVSALFKNRRFYGAMIIHLGLCMIAFGVIGSAFYKSSTDEVVKENSSIIFDEYKLMVKDLRFEQKVNYVSAFVPVSVYKNGRYIITMKPERRFYKNEEHANAEVAIYTTFLGDLYLILASYDKNQGIVGIQALYHPLVVWIWIGCFVMVIGGIYSLSNRRGVEA
ncbi:cytochrome c-type biogenesis protein CcmF [Deferribacter desulfuricans SSM1]|uniref:Cytochrome c-type biogenesis protein CcmF n=1 Tax=Deferribacter desulfuricans (strain DSM 14783 / JCM 11476 / NBRC 101012 / SSM1) TaxID=639282 RepID=D3PAR3_DEFDS|nr:heme lyase CcmF/NrfE family subunit [Deferribacter desulfuricans]BAI79686.1 cytochrome c-type biogenesis protein CcmF [Deferribacter desulfuricans SSM1]